MESASRLEVLIRILYSIPWCFVNIASNIILSVTSTVNGLTSLILGKRVEVLAEITKDIAEWKKDSINYFNFSSDCRPGIIWGARKKCRCL